jgi:WASH complex subunit strumpellin
MYFAGPALLHKQKSTMREIVDKHFSDNWVLTFYMGFSADLTDAWAPYLAAKKALDNVVTKDNINEIVAK